MANATLNAEQRYAPNTDAPRLARHFVDGLLEAAGAEQLEPAANLLTSEVVADAVRHAPSEISVRVELDPAHLRVEVSDDPGIIAAPMGSRFERRARRRLIESIASRWGSDLDRHRTTTWFELAPGLIAAGRRDPSPR